MSAFSEDFLEGVADMTGAFGETLTWVSPAGVSTSVVGIVRRDLGDGETTGTAVDRVDVVHVDVEAGALPADANAVAGWQVVVGGATYTVRRAGLTQGGMWRVEARARVNVSLGLGRK